MGYLNIKFVALVFLISFSIASLAQEEVNIPDSDTTQTTTDFNYELLIAASEGDTAKVLKWIEKGADVNCKSFDEEVTPLMYAAQNGHMETVRLLLRLGAKVNALPRNHISALLGACIEGYVYIADTLILNGADVNTKSFEGVTPLMIAASLNDSVLADMLIFYKADLNIQDNQGNSALHHGTFFGSGAVSELLIEKKAKINLVDNHGFTPLMIAAQNGYNYLADLYISAGSKVDTVNGDNLTALSFAIINNHLETAELLIQNGADPKHLISGVRNQLTLAKEFASNDMQQLLRQNGATEIPVPIVDKVIVTMLLNGSLDDFMAGGTIGIAGSKYGVEFESGYKTRVWVRSVRYEINPTMYYQFWEKRSVMHLGVAKLFKVFQKTVDRNSGVFGGFNFAYTYGNFRGSEKKPDDEFLFIPKAGIFWNSTSFDFKLNYEYMKLKNTNSSPHRFNMSIGFNINLAKGKLALKEAPVW